MNSAETTFKLSHAARPATIRAELIGSDECTALGITVHSFAPVLASCRQLIDAGHDPDRALHAYRGDTLCLTVKSISTGARLRNQRQGHWIYWPSSGAHSPARRAAGMGAVMTVPSKKSGKPLSKDIGEIDASKLHLMCGPDSASQPDDASLGAQVVPQLLTPLRRSRP